MAKKAKPKPPRGWGWTQELPSGGIRVGIRIGGREQRATFPSKELADRWLVEMRMQKVEVESGARRRTGTAEDLTYRDLEQEVKDWWKAGTRRSYSPDTLEGYHSYLSRLLEIWGDRRPVQTRKEDVDSLVAFLRGEGAATSSIAQTLTVLRTIHRYAVDRGYLAQEPCVVSRPRVFTRDVVEPVEEGEFLSLIEEAAREGLDARAIVILAGDAGLRLSEIPRLKARHVDLTETETHFGSIHIAVESEKSRTKSGRGRVVPVLTGRLRDVLAELLARRRSGPLLPQVPKSSKVTTVASPAWRRVFAQWETRKGKTRKVRQKAKLHRLRHRFGTYYAGRGVAPAILQQWMGHANVTTTERYFKHLRATAPVGLKESGYATGTPREALSPSDSPNVLRFKSRDDSELGW